MAALLCRNNTFLDEIIFVLQQTAPFHWVSASFTPLGKSRKYKKSKKVTKQQ